MIKSDVRQLPLFPARPERPEDLTPLTMLRDAIAPFQYYLIKDGKSEHTVTSFTLDLQLLAEQSGEVTQLNQYTTAMLSEFLDWLEHRRGVPCSRKSYARRVTTLKVFFKWLNDINVISHDPAKAILQRSGAAPLSLVLSPQQVDDVITVASNLRSGSKPDSRPEMLFRLLLDTGIKKSEVMELTPVHVDRTNSEHPILIVKHKSARDVYKERKIILQPDWLVLFDEYRSQYRIEDKIFNCTARNLEYILSDLGEEAEIPFKISFEIMRWTCAVRDTRTGSNADHVREKLGLSKISWLETGSKINRLIEFQLGEETN